jgi:hypothetical protein
MLEALFSGIVETLLGIVITPILWVLATPFVLVIAALRRGTFGANVRAGYRAVTSFWFEWGCHLL